MKANIRKKEKSKPVKPSRAETEKPRSGSSIKTKIIAGSIITVILLVTLFTGYFLLTEKMLVRLPVLVQKDVKITFVIGDVVFREKKDGQWKQAIVGFNLKKNYEIKTEANSIADLRFNDGFAVRVAENSHIKIDSLNIKKVQINIERGSMFGKFEKLHKDNDIFVKTPTTIAGIRGTELGFDVGWLSKEMKNKKTPKAKKKEEEPKIDEKKDGENITTVYSISGITEVSNPKFENQKVLLAYENKLMVKENSPPENPQKLTDDELTRVKGMLNSIHTEEVLLISNKIIFKLGSASILPSSYPELDKIVEIFRQKNVKVRIEGHTDNISTDTINQTLSVDRAKAIKDYLVGKGIEEKRFEISGFGSTKPIASNKTEAGRSQNRRVEFIIIE